MPSMKRPQLKQVEALPGHRLSLTFVNDQCLVVDLSQDVKTLPGLAPLKSSKAWSEATTEWGWSVEWPSFDIQIGADTLWLDALEQNASDPDLKEFLAWRSRNALSLADAANALGLTPRTVSAYGTGARPIPRYIILACRGWEAGQPGHATRRNSAA